VAGQVSTIPPVQGWGNPVSVSDYGGRRRSRILDEAQRLFAEKGFDATPTAGIARAAAVPKGLVFYYFPQKIDILLALLAERLPAGPLCDPATVALPGDPGGSLVRLPAVVGLNRREASVINTILFREARTHPEVARHLRSLREALVALTEEVLNMAAERALNPIRRRQAAHTFVAVMIDEVTTAVVDGPLPDLAGSVDIICQGLVEPDVRGPKSRAPQ